MPPAVVEFAFDTTRNVVSLLASGTLARCPNIAFIIPQDGGTLPMLADRISRSMRSPQGTPIESSIAIAQIRKLYFDIATSTSPPALNSLLSLVPSSHVMFGSDFPFLPTAFTAKPFDATRLSAADKAQINRLTAATLLPQYA